MDFDLRPATDADRAFIWALRLATMRPLIEPLEGWDEEQQRSYADESLAGRVVLIAAERVGVLTIRDCGHELHLTWIAVIPARQSAGLGTALLRLAQVEATEAGLPLTLRVMRGNPAVQLYERLGFAAEGAPPTPGPPTDRIAMRWTPSGPAGT